MLSARSIFDKSPYTGIRAVRNKRLDKMNGISRRGFLIAVLAVTAAAWQPSATQAENPVPTLTPAPEGTFTFAIIPDTQRYRIENGEVVNPAFESRVVWLADQIEAQRIVFVSHMGDIINRSTPEHWPFARRMMDHFSGRVPYGITVGNHDYDPGRRSQGESTLFQQYFGADRYADEPWYGGTYEGHPEQGPAVSGNGANSYQGFSAGGLDFIVVHVECNAPDDVLAWVDDVLAQHRNRLAIISTHMYLGGIEQRGADEPQGRMLWKKIHGGRGNTPEEMWDKSFKNHPNLLLVLCGDQSHSITHHQTSQGKHGNLVHEILTDYPRDSDNSDWLRLLRFHPAQGAIEVLTYSPAQGQLCDGVGHKTEWEDHQFVLDISEALATYRSRPRF